MAFAFYLHTKRDYTDINPRYACIGRRSSKELFDKDDVYDKPRDDQSALTRALCISART